MRFGRHFAIFLTLWTSLPAQAESEFAAPPPDQVDLGYQFQGCVPIQKGGTCHIFAAAALAEAACFRRLGKRVDLSEAYLFYRHLRTAMEIRGYYDLQSSPPRGMLTMHDDGYPADTLNLILNEKVCTEKELPFNRSFIDTVLLGIQAGRVKLWQAATRKNQRLDEVDEDVGTEFPSFMCETLNQQVRCEFGKRGLSSQKDPTTSAIQLRTQNVDLLKCFKPKMKSRLEDFSKERAIQLLAEKKPFLCTGKVKYPHLKDPESHAYVILGYRKNPRDPNKLQFLYRDSNLGKHVWGGNYLCDTMITLE